MKASIAFTLLLALCGTASSENYMEELKKVAGACIAEAKADMKDFENLISGKITPEGASENMKCAMKCFMEKSGFITASGEFNADGVKAKLGPFRPADELDRVIQACKDTKGNNPCDMAFKLSNCMAENKTPK